MISKKYLNALQNFSIFVSGVAFSNYFGKILNAKEIREQASHNSMVAENLNTLNENQLTGNAKIDNLNSKIDYAINKFDKKLIDSNSKYSDQVNILSDNENKSTILEALKGCVDRLNEGSDNLQKIAKGEIKPDTEAIVKQIIDNMTTDVEKLKEFVDKLDSSSKKFISDFNINSINDYLNSLTLIQELAFIHIILFIILFCIVLNILGIFFGNELIKYFNLEKKFPSLATFFKLRTTFQRFYLLWNISIMFIVSFAGIFIDVFTYYINP